MTFAVIANDFRKTKILLLDEYDATLNPSLIENFFTILQDFFIDKGIQVIVVTHSPATLSLAPENATFYEVYKPSTQNVRILKVERDQYAELTIANKRFYEKLADQEARLKEIKAENEKLSSLLQEVNDAPSGKLQIITEGNNIKHIQKAISVLKPDLLDKIEFVVGAEHITGKQQLKQAFEIMSKVPLDKKTLFIWDVDAADMVDKLVESATCKKCYFAYNSENKRTPSGIENLYPEELFTDDLYKKDEKPRNDGGQSINTILDKNRFLAKVTSQSDEKIFKKYSSLVQVINQLT